MRVVWLTIGVGVSGCLAVPAPTAGDGGLDAADAIPGLIARWPLDEASSTQLDVAGGHAATCSSCPTRIDSPLGGALEFDGGQSLHVPSAAAFGLTSGTISAWIRLDASHYGTIVARPQGDAGDNAWGLFTVPPHAVAFEVGGAFGTSPQDVVPEGEWRHVAGTFGPGESAVWIAGVRYETSSDAPAFGPHEVRPIVLHPGDPDAALSVGEAGDVLGDRVPHLLAIPRTLRPWRSVEQRLALVVLALAGYPAAGAVDGRRGRSKTNVVISRSRSTCTATAPSWARAISRTM